jgi:hypothetical protein
MLNPPYDAPELKAALLKRFRTHADLSKFVRPVSEEFADLILTRTVLLSQFVDELIEHCQEEDTLKQLRSALGN